MIETRNGFDLLNLYQRIDAKIDDHYKNNPTKSKKLLCAKGCASCCSQFFEVSQAEYIVILNHLKSWNPPQIEELRVKADLCMQLLQLHHTKFYQEFFTQDTPVEDWPRYYNSSERYKIHIPCPFLSEEGACTVYEVRPLICRTTGVGYKLNFEWGSICREMRSAFLAKRWQADLREFNDEILEVSLLDEKTRQYPLFYYTHQSFITGSKN